MKFDATLSAPKGSSTVQGVIVFDVGGKGWTLDLSSGAGTLAKGAKADSDLVLTTNDANFEKLVSGKLNPQQVRACENLFCCSLLLEHCAVGLKIKRLVPQVLLQASAPGPCTCRPSCSASSRFRAAWPRQ